MIGIKLNKIPKTTGIKNHNVISVVGRKHTPHQAVISNLGKQLSDIANNQYSSNTQNLPLGLNIKKNQTTKYNNLERKHK